MMKKAIFSRLAAVAMLLFFFVQVSVAQDAGAAKGTDSKNITHKEHHGNYEVELQKTGDVVRVNVMENGKKVANKGEMTGKLVLVYDDMTSDIVDLQMENYGTMMHKISDNGKKVTHVGAQIWMGEEVVAVRTQL